MFDDLDVLSDLDQLRSRYEILGELGHDGASVVYRGRIPRSDREVAIKHMSTRHPPGAKPGPRFGWQAHTLKQLHHPNLLGLHAVHHLQGGALALSMEPGRLRTLAEVMRGVGPLPLEQVERVLRDVAAALAYLHENGVVHRGVRPQSIYLDEEGGRAVLADFGVDVESEGRGAARGAVIRTFAYLAPEQVGGASQVDGPQLSARTDVYSLALVGYAMLTGRQPWEGESLEGVIARQKGEPHPSPAALRPDVPDPMCRAIEGALDRNPGRRWKSVAEFVAHLDGSVPHAEPARSVDWAAWAGAGRARVEALGKALGKAIGVQEAVKSRARLALVGSAVAAAVATVGILQLSPQPTPRPLVDAGAALLPVAPARAPVAAVPEPTEAAPTGVLSSPLRAVAVELPPVTARPAARSPRTGSADPSPPRPTRPAARRGTPRSSGGASATERIVLLGSAIEPGVPPLLGDPVQP